jgi:hypothetical protein
MSHHDSERREGRGRDMHTVALTWCRLAGDGHNAWPTVGRRKLEETTCWPALYCCDRRVRCTPCGQQLSQTFDWLQLTAAACALRRVLIRTVAFCLDCGVHVCVSGVEVLIGVDRNDIDVSGGEAGTSIPRSVDLLSVG